MLDIEYFYSAHSAFAYLGAARLYKIAADAGARLVHKPILLSPVMEAAGGLPFAARSPAHVDYYFGREIERWSEWRGVAIINHRPTHHDNPLELPNGMLIAADMRRLDVDALSYGILQAHWRDDADIADPGTLFGIAEALGMPAADLVKDALSDEVQVNHRANTEEAIERNVFGSPTYFAGGDMFYGQDHLEMLEGALKKPFRPFNWSNPRVT